MAGYLDRRVTIFSPNTLLCLVLISLNACKQPYWLYLLGVPGYKVRRAGVQPIGIKFTVKISLAPNVINPYTHQSKQALGVWIWCYCGCCLQFNRCNFKYSNGTVVELHSNDSWYFLNVRVKTHLVMLHTLVHYYLGLGLKFQSLATIKLSIKSLKEAWNSKRAHSYFIQAIWCESLISQELWWEDPY